MPALLLDTCVWGGALPVLAAMGHDTIWSGNWKNDPGDSAILNAAYEQSRILVTLDKDFGELAILRGQPHAGIVRLSGFRSSQMATIIDHLLRTYHKELGQGAIITANPSQVRIRKAPTEDNL
jgi:predicted nuclease of predicted toxin-antitoxin system